MNLPTLPTLSPIDVIAGAGTAVGIPAIATKTAAATISDAPQKLTRGVMIVLGLLLIAAGIFSFDKTKSFIINTGKSAAKVAEIAA